MRWKTLAAAAVIGAVAATPSAARESPRAAALRAHTGFLASDLLEGRDTGTKGFELAAAYVEAQFTAAGLRPAGVDGWRQPLTIRRRILDKAEIRYIGPRDERVLANGENVAVDASPHATEEVLDLEMVFVGWGIDAPALGLDDYSGVDVRGKAVVLLEGAPGNLPGAVRAHYSWIQQKERMAAAHGAAAVLTIKSPVRERFSPWDRTRRFRPLPAVGWTGAPPPGTAAPVRATVTLGPSFAQDLFAAAGHDLSPLLAKADAGGVLTQGLKLPGRIRIDRSSRHEDGASPNVIGLISGSDPALKDEYVVVLAHLDHVGIGPEVAGDKIYNGAIDNAGGVAVMLEAARALAAGPAPRRSVLFVATTGEERGLLGADFFATYPTVPRDKIVAAISVDGLMTFHDFGGIVALGAEHSTLGEISARAAEAIGAVHVPDPIPERGNLALSDQYPLLRYGTPVLFPNPARGLPRSGPDGIAAWDAYETKSYHQPSDDMALPVRWDMAARWTDYIEGVIAGAANARHKPTWYRGDPLANLFAPDAPRASRPRDTP